MKTRLLHHRIRVGFVVVIGMLLVATPFLIGHVASNIGLTMLNRLLAQPNGLERHPQDDSQLIEAQAWLRESIALDGGNLGAWRGLGFTLAAQSREAEATDAWHRAGVEAQEFFQRGEVARVAQDYAQALMWYQRMVNLNPASGDGWYGLGLTHSLQEDWIAARRALEQAVRVANFVETGQSSAYYRLGVIDQYHLNPPQIPAALEAYMRAIQLNDFSLEAEEADAHYKVGTICEVEGRSPKECLAEYSLAVLINPKHQWAHLKKGYMLYLTENNLTAAEGEIEQALALWPNDASRKWPYRYLGDIYREAGLIQAARTAYQEALRLDPNDQYLVAALRTLTSVP